MLIFVVHLGRHCLNGACVKHNDHITLILQSTRGWNRLIIEKPFGSDSESSAKLSKELATFFREDQVRAIE
jgi:glucose-6-phosphate 1-dehydrogenase